MGNQERFKTLANGAFTESLDGVFGATDSAHEVFFGRLGGKEVVVKPHDVEDRAIHEAKMLKVAAGLGFTAVKPLKIMPDYKASGAYLVTERMPSLVSAASLPFEGSTRRLADTFNIVHDVAETMADMHATGLSHGDAQIKNFGLKGDVLNPRTRRPQIAVYDLEKGGTDQIGHVKNDPYGHDLSSLTQSLAYKGYGGEDMDVAAAAIEQSVLEPYYDRVTDMGMSPTIANEVVTTAYTKFLDKRSQIEYVHSHSGHNGHSYIKPL